MTQSKVAVNQGSTAYLSGKGQVNKRAGPERLMGVEIGVGQRSQSTWAEPSRTMANREQGWG